MVGGCCLDSGYLCLGGFCYLFALNSVCLFCLNDCFVLNYSFNSMLHLIVVLRLLLIYLSLFIW